MSERQPNNLKGLLKFAMEATKSEDAPNSANVVQMSEERRQFLEEVISAMSIDVAQEFQKALETLNSDSSSDDDKIKSMELLQDFIDNVDHANNFVKVGGANVLISCLESKNANIRKLATALIADLSQNNPFCQSVFGTDRVFQTLINTLNDDAVSSGAMHAISCIVRHNEKALSSFVKIGGLECLVAGISSSNENIVIKTSFLISSLASEFPYIKDQLVNLETVETLANNLKPDLNNAVKPEMILSALLNLTRCDAGKIHLRSSNLEPILKELIRISTNKPEFQEIEEYSKELLNLFQISTTDIAER